MYDSKYKEYLEIINTSKGVRCVLRKEMSNMYFKLCESESCEYIITDSRIIFYKYIDYLERYIIITIPIFKNTKIEKYIAL